MSIYVGPFATWTMENAAIAAARYPGVAPTWEGLEKLQQLCWESGSSVPGEVRLADVEYKKDYSWAAKAFRDVHMSFRF